MGASVSAWDQEQGIAISSRGRIPADILSPVPLPNRSLRPPGNQRPGEKPPLKREQRPAAKQ